jgi:hypothetical protein
MPRKVKGGAAAEAAVTANVNASSAHQTCQQQPAHLPTFYRELSLILGAGFFVRTAELSWLPGWVKAGLTWTYPGPGVPDLHSSSATAGR